MSISAFPRSGASDALVWRPGDGPGRTFEADERPGDGSAATAAFMYEREPDPAFVAELRVISPVQDAVTWLLPHWESGDPWNEAQRWVLYQMEHEDAVDMEILEELEGPHPRERGHICTSLPTHAWPIKPPADYQPCFCRRKTESWRGGRCSLITLTQWTLWRTTGRYAIPFWIVQGTAGGHRWHFSAHESRLLRQNGLPDMPPPLRSLPYAPFDQRVLKQVMKHNRLVQLEMEISEYKRAMGPGFEAHKASIAKQQRANWLEYLRSQLVDVSELAAKAAKQGALDGQIPVSTIDYERLDEKNDEHYVETGRILHHTEL